MLLPFFQEGVRNFPEFRCDLVPAWVTNFPGHLAYAVPKESAYSGVLFHKILELSESGAIDIMGARWHRGEPQCTPARVARYDVSMAYDLTMAKFLQLRKQFPQDYAIFGSDFPALTGQDPTLLT